MNIQQLIDRFMAGETSLDEEQQLARYFRTHDVPDDLLPYKQMFAYFDSGMDDRALTPQQAEADAAPSKRWARILLPAAAAASAAAVALLLVLTFWHRPAPTNLAQNQSGTPVAADTIAAPQDTLPAISQPADSAQKDAVAPAPQPRKASPRHYQVSPPRYYMAKTLPAIIREGNAHIDEMIAQQEQSMDDYLQELQSAMEQLEQLADAAVADGLDDAEDAEQ